MKVRDRKVSPAKLKDHPLVVIRNKRNITQNQMALELGVTQPTISNIENGRLRDIDFGIVKSIRKTYKVNINKLIDEGRI